jgi:hypothetical protein
LASAAFTAEMEAISFCLRSISESLLDKELVEVLLVIDRWIWLIREYNATSFFVSWLTFAVMVDISFCSLVMVLVIDDIDIAHPYA